MAQRRHCPPAPLPRAPALFAEQRLLSPPEGTVNPACTLHSGGTPLCIAQLGQRLPAAVFAVHRRPSASAASPGSESSPCKRHNRRSLPRLAQFEHGRPLAQVATHRCLFGFRGIKTPGRTYLLGRNYVCALGPTSVSTVGADLVSALRPTPANDSTNVLFSPAGQSHLQCVLTNAF